MKPKPNWRKGDVLALLQTPDNPRSVISILESEYDPEYRSTGEFTHVPGWYYGRRRAEEFRLATAEDVDNFIRLTVNMIDTHQKRLDMYNNLKSLIEGKT